MSDPLRISSFCPPVFTKITVPKKSTGKYLILRLKLFLVVFSCFLMAQPQSAGMKTVRANFFIKLNVSISAVEER